MGGTAMQSISVFKMGCFVGIGSSMCPKCPSHPCSAPQVGHGACPPNFGSWSCFVCLMCSTECALASPAGWNDMLRTLCVACAASAFMYDLRVIRQPANCKSCWASASTSVLRFHNVRLTTRALFACCPGGCAGGSPRCGLRVRGAWPCRYGSPPIVLRHPRPLQLLHALRRRGPLVVTLKQHALVLSGFTSGVWRLLDSATGGTRHVAVLRPSFAFAATFAHDRGS